MPGRKTNGKAAKKSRKMLSIVEGRNAQQTTPRSRASKSAKKTKPKRTLPTVRVRRTPLPRNPLCNFCGLPRQRAASFNQSAHVTRAHYESLCESYTQTQSSIFFDTNGASPSGYLAGSESSSSHAPAATATRTANRRAGVVKRRTARSMQMECHSMRSNRRSSYRQSALIVRQFKATICSSLRQRRLRWHESLSERRLPDSSTPSTPSQS